MAKFIIVALPESSELVWDLSTEEKPHVTLLYLEGPMDVKQEDILGFVKHAVDTTMYRFGLSVDRRGTLGPDDADVLFFENGQDSSTRFLREFRAQLLKDDNIQKMYVAADQFPGWIPHLTMGYPNRPAKEPDRDDRYALKWINFDRIAVWLSPYDGPEFELEDRYADVSVDPAMWSEPDGVYIMHSGVKGMRWGVRRKVGPDGLVTGSVKKAIDDGQIPRTDKKGDKKNKLSDDHKTLVKNLKKDVSTLSTKEVKDITGRIKALNEFKATQKAEQDAKRSAGDKLARWALSAVRDGVKQKGESWLKEFAGDQLEGVLPKTPSAKKRDEKEAQAKRDRERKERREDEQDQQKREDRQKQNESADDTDSDSRDQAVRDLVDAVADSGGVYNVTNLPKKRGS